MNKYSDTTWDFKKANTKDFTHCFHNYPAMMIPQIARSLLNKYGNKARLLFDPYCGTGTSLVEANLKGINAVGTDLNPLARLIAGAKTSVLDLNNLGKHIETIIRNIPNKRMPSKNSPSNIAGVKSSTMKNEFIVVCRKK